MTRSAPAEGTAQEFAVVVDTREQLPWLFGDGVAIVSDALPAGDYAIAGAETRCAIERKSLADFIGSITHGRDRFKRELVKLRDYEFAAVIVEANLADVFQRRYRAQVHPNAILGNAIAITVDYAPVIWAGDRTQAAEICVRLLRRFWEKRVVGDTERRSA